MSDCKLQYFILICDRKKKNTFIELLSASGAVGIETIYARGSARAGVLAKAFGFEVEEHKVVISGLLKTSRAVKLTRKLCEEYGFNHPNTGVAFSIPVDGLGI